MLRPVQVALQKVDKIHDFLHKHFPPPVRISIIFWLDFNKLCLAQGQGFEPTTRPHEYTFTSDGQKAQVLFAFALMKGGGQCNQIWRNFATLAKRLKSWAIFGGLN